MSITTTEGNSKRKTISPYDLTSGDNPGAIISQPLLNGLNYDEWAINFRMALSSRKKFGFIDGTIPKPAAGSPYLEDWTANNHLLVGWIKLTIEPKIRSTKSTREVAKDLWDIIQKHFSIKSGARLQQLRNQPATCKQQGTSVDDYFGRLTKLWDGIAECTNSKRCSCNKCECELNTAREKELEVLKVHDFLSGFDDAVHGVVCSQICAISPLPDLDTVYQTIVQNETIRSGVVKDAEVMSFASQISASSHSLPRDDSRTGGFSQNRDASRFIPVNRDPSRVCTGCGRSGHEVSGCFKIIGYPEWWEDKPRKNKAPSGRGHGFTPKANNAQIISANSASTSSAFPITDVDREGLAGVSDAQWRTVQKMFSSANISDRLSGKNGSVTWILDTGATHHMTGQSDLLQDIHPISPVFVKQPAGELVPSSQRGTVFLTPYLCLKNVYLVPGLHTNLISFGQLATDNHIVGEITDRLLIIQDRTTRMLIGVGDREGEGLYRFHEIETVTSNQTTVEPAVDEASADTTLWHRRLGHPSSRVLGKVPGISGLSSSSLSLLHDSCDICFRAKQTRQCFQDSLINAKEVFDLIHCDLWDPYRTPAFCGSRYFLTIVDDCSRAVWLYLLPDKTNVAQQLRNFLSMVTRHFSKKVKTIRSDNGTEFMCMSRFFQEQGIIHETSCVHTPQQNGRVERKHRHILNVARALRFQGNLPVEFWGECVLNAAYLINRTPSQVLKGKTPFEVLHSKLPSFKHLRVFGCLAYAHNLDHKGDKFESRSRRCVFVGYPYGKKGWRLYDLDRQIFFTSRDVVFCETIFPLSQKQPKKPILQQSEEPPVIVSTEDSIEHFSVPSATEPAEIDGVTVSSSAESEPPNFGESATVPTSETQSSDTAPLGR